MTATIVSRSKSDVWHGPRNIHIVEKGALRGQLEGRGILGAAPTQNLTAQQRLYIGINIHAINMYI